MHLTRFKRPSPALVVAMVALFVALGGTAGAVVAQAVPLAKRALVADRAKVADKAKTALVAENAKKLGGQTSAQIAQQAAQAALSQSPAGARPASTTAGLTAVKSVPFTLSPSTEQVITAACDAGSKAMGGGFSNPTNALVLSAGSFPTADGSGWTEDLINLSTSTTGSGTIVVTCLK